MTRRFPIHVHIWVLFTILTIFVGGGIGWLGYRAASDILRTAAQDISTRIGTQIESNFARLLAPAEMATRLLSQDELGLAESFDERFARLRVLHEALKNSEVLASLYVGYGNGDFFMVHRMANDRDRQTLNAPANAVYLVQSIDRPDDQPRGLYFYLDERLSIVKSEERPDYAVNYDPRTREWYRAAMDAGGQIKTEPYVFFSTGEVGTTIANRAFHGHAVIGADIRLETLDQSLAGQKVTPATRIAVANHDGLTLASDDAGKATVLPAEAEGKLMQAPIGDLSPVFKELTPVLKALSGDASVSQSLTAAGELWHASIRPLHLEGMKPLYVVTAIPDSELMAAANSLIRNSGFAIAAIILLSVPFAWLLARGIARPLRALAAEADTIRHFDFSRPVGVRSIMLEVDELARTMGDMKGTIRRFLDLNQSAAAEKNFERLLPHLLGQTLSSADSDAGVLYLADAGTLNPAAALLADGSPLPGTLKKVDVAAAGPLLDAALTAGQAGSAPLAAADIDTLGLGEALRASATTHAIAVPLLNRERVLVGLILLLRRESADSAHLRFVEAVSGSLAVSLEAKELIHAQQLLFEAIIRLIANAIDTKSPYTGGHCARVPEITKMLARAACAATSGPFAGFNLSDEEWEAVHVAAWLHDCGKVTTPEYVVDKATKLETLYDRIHEVRMRFEVLKRDAEIACLKAVAAGEPEAEARARLAAEWRQFDDDFAFVAECNEGGEFMAPARLERLAAIARRTWLRTLDDRIGISHEEKQRKSHTPAPELPVAEPLLADKREHELERRPADRMPPDNPWGFRMAVPELLYNRGELHNLSIVRGTLSDEERYKINEHIVRTLIMLTQLPFPKHLRDVPEIAGCHHETMDGTGYPRRLTREQIGPVARMMAIADIFEALTAVDRPYKKGKTLTEALKIMARMRDEQHIDPDLFDLFLTSGVWRDYAGRFLRPEQIDEVDVSAFAAAPTNPAPA